MVDALTRSVRLATALCVTVLALSIAGTARAQAPVRVEVPFESVDGYIFIEARVNGSEPLAFMLDNTTRSALDPDVAVPATVMPGATASAVSAKERVLEHATVDVAGAKLGDVALAPLAMKAFEPTLGHRWDGVLGREWFERYVVDVDYEKHVVVFTEPRAFAAPAGVEHVPLVLESGLPYADASVAIAAQAPLSGKFLVDVGANTGVTVYAAFLKRGRMLQTQRSALEPGGSARIVRADALQLGSTRLREPIVELASDAGVRVGADPAAGLLGNEVLSRFHVTMDYSRREMLLARTDAADAPFRTDASGMKLVAPAGRVTGLEIAAVAPGSAAARAGLEPGDRLVAIDDMNGRSLADARETLRDAGATHSLTIERGGRTFKTPIELRAPL